MTSRKRIGVGVASLALAGGLGYAIRATASGVPTANALSYAGVLEDASGPVTGPHNIQVIVYDAATAGNNLCQSTTAPVGITDGHFSVSLPSGCATVVGANQNLWVDVLVDGSDTGRTKIGAVPYALEANHAVSADSATKATSASALPWTGLTAVPAPIQAIGNGAIEVSSGGQVGVGTATPYGKFTVADPGQTDPSGLPAENLFLGHVHSPGTGWDATGMCATGSSGTDMCIAANGGTWFWGAQATPTGMNTIMTLGSTGNLAITGTLSQASSAAVKKDIHFLEPSELDQVLHAIETTPVATFRYVNAAPGSKVNYGVIAEKTQSLLLSDNGQGINLSNTVGALLASVKAQQAQIAKLEARVQDLQARHPR